MGVPTLSLPRLLKRAFIGYERGKLGKAEELCKSVLAAQRDYLDALHLLEAVQFRLGRLADALANYDNVLALRPDLVDALNHRANLLMKRP